MAAKLADKDQEPIKASAGVPSTPEGRTVKLHDILEVLHRAVESSTAKYDRLRHTDPVRAEKILRATARLIADMAGILYAPAREAGFNLEDEVDRAAAADWLDDRGQPTLARWLRDMDERRRQEGAG
jgi:hypothetical protein